eukprot:sb/3475286/
MSRLKLCLDISYQIILNPARTPSLTLSWAKLKCGCLPIPLITIHRWRSRRVRAVVRVWLGFYLGSSVIVRDNDSLSDTNKCSLFASSYAKNFKVRFKRLDLRFLEIGALRVIFTKRDPEFPGISGQVV